MDLGTAVSIVSVMLTLAGGLWYLSARLTRIDTILASELTINGGASVKATVIRIEERLHTQDLQRAADAERPSRP